MSDWGAGTWERGAYVSHTLISPSVSTRGGTT
jgi:hypothetical protein